MATNKVLYKFSGVLKGADAGDSLAATYNPERDWVTIVVDEGNLPPPHSCIAGINLRRVEVRLLANLLADAIGCVVVSKN